MKKIKTVFTTILLALLAYALPAQLASNALETYLKDHQINAQKGTDGIFYQVSEAGSGDFPKSGDYVQVNYIGKLLDGKVFDQSKAGEPITFQLGRRQVIRGWELGVPLFRKGGKGVLYLPAEVAYGKRGAGKSVPADAPLIFEIELVNIMDIDAYDRYMEAQEAKEKREYERRMAEQFEKDKVLIRDYAKAHKLKVKETP